MSTLNRSQSYGKISPPYQPDEFDRPAYYEQAGKMFDAHGRLIVPGVALAEPAADAGDNDPGGNDGAIDVVALYEGADSMPWPVFRKKAREVLGETCPSDKAGIKVALGTAIEKFNERKAKKAADLPETKSAGLTFSSLTGDAEHTVGTVNLRAWGAGRQQYIFGEVAKAIRTKYHKQVSERRDAVDFLIEQGVVTKAEARKDV